MTAEKSRKIQIVKGLCILSIITVHCTLWTTYSPYLRIFLNYSVSTFIFISGYLTKLRDDNYLSVMKKRIPRVIVPYIFWSILYILILKRDGNPLILLLTAGANTPYYYIFVYVQLTLLLPVFAFFAKHKKLWWMPFLVTPIFHIVYYTLTLKGVIIVFPANNIFFFPWTVYFYLGFLIGNGIIQKRFKTIYLLIAFTAVCALDVFEINFWLDFKRYDLCDMPIMFMPMMISLVYQLLFVNYFEHEKFKAEGPVAKVLKTVGDLSFGMYLIHNMVITILHYNVGLGQYPRIVIIVSTMVVSALIVFAGAKILPDKVAKYIGFK